MKTMKAKTFVIFMMCAFVAATGVLIGANVFANKKWGAEADWKTGRIHSVEPLLREEKALYIGQEFVPFNAYIIGGSKAGFLQKQKLDFYSGNNFYNFFSTSGGFRDYKLYSEYLIKKHGGKMQELLLHLSTYETERFSYGDYIPSPMRKFVFLKPVSKFQIFKAKYLNVDSFISLFKKYLNKGKDDYAINENGEYVMTLSKSNFTQSPDVYVQKYVISPCNDMGALFANKSMVSAYVCKQNIEAVKYIKSLCDENGIRLTLVIGAHYIGKLSEIWGNDFDNYLRDLVSVADGVWNFCGINDVNMNPYNFFNDGHFWDFTGNKMIETIYSPAPNTTDLDAFGILLTADNIESYIARQHEKWLALKTEYETTGTIALQSKDDASYLGTRP